MTQVGSRRRAWTVLVAGAGAVACAGDRPAPVDSAAQVGASTSVAVDPAAPTGLAIAPDSAPAMPAAVAEFLAYVQAPPAPPAPDSAVAPRDVAARGLQLLAAAIEAVVAPVSVADTTQATAADTTTTDPATTDAAPARLAALRARADSVGRAPRAADHARLVAESFAIASELLLRARAGAPPTLTDRAGEVRQAAAAIRTDRPLAEQGDAVRRFFERSAAALRGIVGARPL